MSVIRAKRDGELVQILITQDEIEIYDAPETTVYTLEIDPKTNAALLQHMNAHIDAYRLVGDTLTVAGEPVVILPSTAETQRLKALRTNNRTELDESTFVDADALLRQLANKIAWLEQEWRALQARITSEQ